MRRRDKEITESDDIQEIIDKSIICRIAFHDDEFPYVVPMNYGYKDGALYFHCATVGKKLELIKRNPKVAFEITEKSELVPGQKSCEWTEHYRSIFGTGTMTILEDFTQKLQGLDVLMQHHGKVKNAYDPKLVERVVVLKLDILNMTAKQNG